jgi:hypothetical protein
MVRPSQCTTFYDADRVEVAYNGLRYDQRPGRDNGFVHLGDPVAIKFDTFPCSQYSMAEGSVRTISPGGGSHLDWRPADPG